jgi:hypothetical protein
VGDLPAPSSLLSSRWSRDSLLTSHPAQLYDGAILEHIDEEALEHLIRDLERTKGPLHVGAGRMGVFTWDIACTGADGAFTLQVPLLLCLTFGALISPTDPIAVMGLLKELKAPRSLESQIAGESLFNDGIGVVCFFALLSLIDQPAAAATEHVAPGATTLTLFFVREVGGGALLGLGLGYIAYRAMKSIDESLSIVASDTSEMAVVARAAGIDVIREAFADRRYTPEGTLVSRKDADALLSIEEAAEQAYRLATRREVIARGGTAVPIEFDTICIHADTPNAVERARAIRARLTT